MSARPTAGNDAGWLTEQVAQVIERHASMGTSGRWIIDYGVSPIELAEAIVARVIPPASGDAS